MALSQHPSVVDAYNKGEYTDKYGTTWQRGMDGWFDRSDPSVICLQWHHHFVSMVEEENPIE